MPNWVDCELEVTGPPEKVEEFKQKVKGDGKVLDANKIIPYPKVLAAFDKLNPLGGKTGEESSDELDQLKLEGALEGYDLHKDGYNQGGYEWCIANWGTKQGFCHSEIVSEYTFQEENKTTLEYSFDTAWSPPLPLIEKMGEMFPELKFELRYFEGGAGFNGLFRMEDGKVEKELQGDYFGHRGG